EAAHDVLVRELLHLDPLADLGLAQTVEALAALQAQAVESDATVSRRALLLLPAEDLEESLACRRITALARDVLDGLLVAGLDEPLEQRRVDLARVQPLLGGLSPAPERRLAAARARETCPTVEPRDLRRLEQLRDAEDGARRHHAARLLLVEQQHRLA